MFDLIPGPGKRLNFQETLYISRIIQSMRKKIIEIHMKGQKANQSFVRNPIIHISLIFRFENLMENEFS
jgi:hypothetical protein